MKVKSFMKIIISIFLIAIIRKFTTGYFSAISSLFVGIFGVGVSLNNLKTKKPADNSKYEKYYLFSKLLKGLEKANEHNYLSKIVLHAGLYLFTIASLSSLSFLLNNSLFSLIVELVMALYTVFFSLIAFTYLMKPVYECFTVFKAIILVATVTILLLIIGSFDIDKDYELIASFLVPFISSFLGEFIKRFVKRNTKKENLSGSKKSILKAIDTYAIFLPPILIGGFIISNKIPDEILEMISKDNRVLALGFVRVLIPVIILGLIVIIFTILDEKEID